jgi:CubicO group peptidase (beta-lactamase class C family)
MVMQAASGRDFRPLIQDEIGRHFALPSLADDDPWAIRPGRASGYINDHDIALLYGSIGEAARPRLTDGWANMPFSNPAYSWAAGGFIMTPSDAARFGAAMLEGSGSRIDSKERALLFTPLTEKTARVPAMGLGWRISTDAKNRLRWHHEGATPGGRYALTVYPKPGLAVAIGANEMFMPLDVGKASSDLADIFG